MGNVFNLLVPQIAFDRESEIHFDTHDRLFLFQTVHRET